MSWTAKNWPSRIYSLSFSFIHSPYSFSSRLCRHAERYYWVPWCDQPWPILMTASVLVLFGSLHLLGKILILFQHYIHLKSWVLLKSWTNIGHMASGEDDVHGETWILITSVFLGIRLRRWLMAHINIQTQTHEYTNDWKKKNFFRRAIYLISNLQDNVVVWTLSLAV